MAHTGTTSATPAWAAGSEEQTVQTELGRLSVRVGGKRNGPAMVFWPSLMMSGSMWKAQYAHYAPTHRVVLIDPPGIGGSQPLRKVIDLEECAACLLAVLNALSIERCLFVGNSWGALLGSVFAAWHPERLTGAVLANGTASPASRSEKLKMSPLITAVKLHRTVPRWLLPVAQSAFAGDTATSHKPEFMASLRCIRAEDPTSIAYAMRSILLGRKDQHALLATISDVPVLVLAGQEDRQFSVATVRRMAQAIPGSRFVVLPKTGHLAPMESPDEVNAAIDAFIAGTTGVDGGTRPTTT